MILPQTWPNVNIPEEFYVDLQHLYRLPGTNKVGMKVMVVDLIDPWYADMKAFPYKAHSFWEKRPLYKINKDYAAIDGFVAFELYRVMLERIAAGQPLGYQLQDASEDDSGSDVPEDSEEEEELEEENKRRKLA